MSLEGSESSVLWPTVENYYGMTPVGPIWVLCNLRPATEVWGMPSVRRLASPFRITQVAGNLPEEVDRMLLLAEKATNVLQ